jgi:hypothetical protein
LRLNCRSSSTPRFRGRCPPERAADRGCTRGARKTQSLHQITWAHTFFEGSRGEEETVGSGLIDLRQADEGKMDLRQRFFAGAPKFTGAANLFDDASGNGFAMGGSQKGKDARFLTLEEEMADPAPSFAPAILWKGGKKCAAPKHDARGKCHFTMKRAA